MSALEGRRLITWKDDETKVVSTMTVCVSLIHVPAPPGGNHAETSQIVVGVAAIIVGFQWFRISSTWARIKLRFRAWRAARQLSFQPQAHGAIQQVQEPEETHEMEELHPRYTDYDRWRIYDFETQSAHCGRVNNKRLSGDEGRNRRPASV